MSDDRLLGIGKFSVLTGLSIPALRHYDEVGLLRPVSVDSVSGYRRYGLDQVPTGRLIRVLRAVELPIEAIREVIIGDDAEATRAALVEHRSRLAVRSRALAKTINALDDYIDNGVPMAEAKGCRIVEINLDATDVEAAWRFYEAAFGVEFAREQHNGGPVHVAASFGSWPSEQFFLLNIVDAAADPIRVGKGNFGFLVDDLDAAHKRAIAAGATEVLAPSDVSGMPRTSTIDDPGGNRINLYQDVADPN